MKKGLPILNIVCAICFGTSAFLQFKNGDNLVGSVNMLNSFIWIWIAWINSKGWRQEVKDKKNADIERLIQEQKKRDAEALFQKHQFDFTGMQNKMKK